MDVRHQDVTTYINLLDEQLKSRKSKNCVSIEDLHFHLYHINLILTFYSYKYKFSK